MSITLIRRHKTTNRLSEIAQSLSIPKAAVSDRDASEIILTLGDAKGVVALNVHTAGSVGLLIDATNDLVDLAGGRDVFCSVGVGAWRRCGN